ncbi:uncharacterized protein LOC143362997 [Halictus rubicundus]|uniref:uncharacterized protein LOC143362997 n=1 Tax=Halictus rubicundus TaxID=77578 RepID=UPI0040368508
MSRASRSKRRTPARDDEQLYMLEVFIDKVKFNPERADANVQNLTIFVKFSDLPEYELSILKNLRDDRTENRELSENSNVFKSGKSCLFAKSPSSLIRAIRFAPLRLEVYHKESSERKGNRDLVGTVKVTLPSCMCTYVSNVRKETDGLSTPCVAKSDFDLIDPGGQVTGTVCVVLRLSCFGSSIVKHFLLNGKTFMLEDSPIQKFLCPHLAPTEDKKDTAEPSLRRPDSPPRISMDDPGFVDLTTAEKLNDPKFRELVYRAYPDEPTCHCQPTDRSTHPMECRSGCTRPCCMKLRNPELLLAHQPKPVDDSLSNTYCVNDYLTPKEDRQDCVTTRLRGGGDIEQIYLGPTSQYKWPDYDTDYTWYEDKNARTIRLEGGGENDMSSCGCSGGTVPVRPSQSKQQSVQAAFDACKPRITSTGPRAACACAGKDTQMWHTGVAKCSKQPCLGIDCLIRAFKETQEFVDSIGKVPGLAGLGLMDPSESPYFGRDVDKDYVPKEPPPKYKKKEQTTSQQTLPQSSCTAPCNRPALMASDDRPPVLYTPSAPLGAVMVPPRLGIVREAIPVLPDVAPVALGKKRRDEKKGDDKDKTRDRDGDMSIVGIMDLQNGPCGEPMCKSRRKTTIDAVDGALSPAVTSSKSKAGRKMPSAKKRRGGKGGKFGGGKGRIRTTVRQKGGAGGDFDGGFDQGKVVRPSKKIMRYVYFVGDYYPGINYGHRDCIDIRMRVPANMGWLWNTLSTPGNLKPRIGWRPGAIGRNLYAMLQEAKEESYTPEESMSATTTRSADRGKGGRGGKGGGDRGRTMVGRGRPGLERTKGGAVRLGRSATLDRNRGKSATSARQRSPRRTGGRASASMKGAQSALEDEEATKDPPTLHIHRKDGTYYVTMYPIRQEPPDEAHVSEPMKPLQFKIVKNKDEASIASSSTASDMEIEFSPPAAVTRSRKKPDVIHVETQVRQQEILDEIKAESAKKKDKRSRREKKTTKPDPEKKEPAKGKGKA